MRRLIFPRLAWLFVVLCAVAPIAEGLSAVHRGAHGKSDIGVFYRSAVLLSHGAGGAFYVGRDAVTGWYRCIPPAGLLWWAPYAGLSPRAASFAWMLENLLFLLVGALSLRALLNALDTETARAALPFAVGLLFLVASPSLEVGQYSLMFAALWLLATACATARRRGASDSAASAPGTRNAGFDAPSTSANRRLTAAPEKDDASFNRRASGAASQESGNAQATRPSAGAAASQESNARATRRSAGASGAASDETSNVRATRSAGGAASDETGNARATRHEGAAHWKLDVAAVLLALPSAIKIYPALLLLYPLCVLSPKKWPRFVLAFGVGCAFWTWMAPLPFYGARVAGLQSAFWREVVLSPTGRLSESQNTRALSNHGLDAVLLRFGSNSDEPTGAPPHFGFEPRQILALVNPLRAALIALSLAFWWRRRRNDKASQGDRVRVWLDSLALWSATLFLIMPGAKARYAVYAFAAFLPLVLHTATLFQGRQRNRWFYALFIAVLGALVMSLVPFEARLWGAGFWGALALWIENGRLLRRAPVEASALLSAPPPLAAKT